MATPQTRRDDTVDTLHGQQVADPYRWLEDPDSTETRAWVAEQNRHSREHLDALPCREWFRRTMTGVVGRPRAGTPDKVGDRYVVSRNDGSQQQDLWFVADTLEELRQGGRLLLDPNTFSEDGTSSLAGYNASKDGRWLAFLVSDGGSDWSSIRLLDLAGGHEVDDVVRKVKFSEATWLPDHSSYLYLHYPTEGSGVGTEAAALPGGQLRRHYVGEPQDNDELVLELPENPRLSISPTLSHDGRWLAVSLHEGTSEKNRLWFYPVQTADGATVIGEPLKVVDEAVAGFDPVRFDGDQVFLWTDLEAPLGRVVRLDLTAFPDTGRADLVDVVPESDSALRGVHAVGAELLGVHLVDVQPRLTRYALDGSVLGTVDVPGGAVVALNGDVDDDEVFLGMSSVTRRTTAYRLDLGSGDVEELTGLEPVGDTDWTAPEVVTERRRATSTDGTEVPYFLVRREDVPLDAPRPTLLYGYGGFDIPELATFRPIFAGWLAAGGVLVIANLRGGGEFGAAWHDAGRLERKQNVFDDFLVGRGPPRRRGRHDAGPARAARRQQRRPAGRRGDHPAARRGGGRAARGRRDGHAALPPVHDRRGLDLRLRLARGPGDVRDPAGLLAAAQRAQGHGLPGDAGDHRRPRRPGRAGAQLQVHRGAAARARRGRVPCWPGSRPPRGTAWASRCRWWWPSAPTSSRSRPSTPASSRADRTGSRPSAGQKPIDRWVWLRTTLPFSCALARRDAWNSTIFVRSASSEAARMRTASRPALRALPTATVATGTPAGICTIESSESMPSRYFRATGTPITGSGVTAASMPGRCAAPPAPAMITRSPRPAASLP